MRLLLIVAVVLLAGCADTPRPSAPDLAGLRARLGLADVFTASLLVQITPATGDGEQFSLRLWRNSDGAVRVRAQKLDVDFLEALLRADGGYEALLPRERVATAGALASPDAPLLLRDLQLLLSDLRDGPLPRTVVPTGEAGRLTWTETNWNYELDLAVDGLPSAKRLSADGVVQRDITYARWQAYEGLMRPSQVRLRVAGDDGVMAIRLKSFDTPPTISAERMALRLPDGVERVTPAEFSRRLP